MIKELLFSLMLTDIFGQFNVQLNLVYFLTRNAMMLETQIEEKVFWPLQNHNCVDTFKRIVNVMVVRIRNFLIKDLVILFEEGNHAFSPKQL